MDIKKIKEIFCNNIKNALVLEFNNTFQNFNINSLRPEENISNKIENIILEDDELKIIYNCLKKLKKKFKAGIYIISNSDKSKIVIYLKNQKIQIQNIQTNLYDAIFKENDSDIDGNRIYTSVSSNEIYKKLEEIKNKNQISKDNIFYFNNIISEKYIKYLSSQGFNNIFNTTVNLQKKKTGRILNIYFSYIKLLKLLIHIKITDIKDFFSNKNKMFELHIQINKFMNEINKKRRNTKRHINYIKNKSKKQNNNLLKRLGIK
jgi:hypothetical protein